MKTTTSSKWKSVYFFALFPILSVGLYLLLMVLGQAEDFAVGGILAFIAVTAFWGFVGSLFARARLTLGKSLFIANAIPLLTTAVYTVLYVIARFSDSEPILNAAEVIGGLGTGIFGILGTMLYAIIPVASKISLFEVYINIVFMLVVFAVGFSIGTSSHSGKKTAEKKLKTR